MTKISAGHMSAGVCDITRSRKSRSNTARNFAVTVVVSFYYLLPPGQAKRAQEDEAKRRAREAAVANKAGYHSNKELQKSRNIMQVAVGS